MTLAFVTYHEWHHVDDVMAVPVPTQVVWDLDEKGKKTIELETVRYPAITVDNGRHYFLFGKDALWRVLTPSKAPRAQIRCAHGLVSYLSYLHSPWRPGKPGIDRVAPASSRDTRGEAFQRSSRCRPYLHP